MPPRKEPSRVGPRPIRGDVSESSSSNPIEQVNEDTLLRDLIPPRGVSTRRDDIRIHIEEGEVPQPVVQVQETAVQKCLKLITGFSKLMPMMFEGGADPMVADDYMDQVENHLTSMDVTDDHLKIILATYKFSKDAKLWWKLVINQHKVEDMIWEMFKELFYEKYFSVTKRWELRKQFDDLIQGNMSVIEYENKFTSLSRFASEIVKSEVDKTRKLISGFHYQMRPLITSKYFKVYLEAVERALMLEAEANDRNVGKEQWKQKRNTGSSSEGPSWKKNKGGPSQSQGQ
ncbi:uncharacterized protein LOC132305035 [Cornus florida]|uniref:uncharacterized protein LOC132305035 n=1 Tax=Cornus florida TaxID=4283 RepID=UPI002899635A|nr:uncharacterized protein LOC132305035 [Cornus florida]